MSSMHRSGKVLVHKIFAKISQYACSCLDIVVLTTSDLELVLVVA